MGALQSRRRVVAGGQVDGVPVVLRVSGAVGSKYRIHLGLTADRRIVAEWEPALPSAWGAADLAKRINGPLAALLLAASARPGLLVQGFRIGLPPVSVSRKGGPLKRRRAKGDEGKAASSTKQTEGISDAH